MPGNLAYEAYQLIWVGLDWIFPPECGGCGKKGSRWCGDCLSSSQIIGDNCCELCGDITVSGGICFRCQQARPEYTQARSFAVFQGSIRNLIHRLKYKGDMSLGEALAKPLISDLKRIGWKFDMVIPVPLSLARMAERGYNQAALIALPVAMGLQVPYRGKAMQKVRHTRSQVGLSFDERLINLVDAFEVDVKIVAGKKVLLIDDVTTSGATLNESARVLKAARAQDVYGYTFARAAHNRFAANTEMPTDGK